MPGFWPSPSLPWTTLAPRAPDDLTVEDVRKYLDSHRDVTMVVISSAWHRSQKLVAPWQRLEGELGQEKIKLIFANGVATWEGRMIHKTPVGVPDKAVTPAPVDTPLDSPGVTPFGPSLLPLDLEPVPPLHSNGPPGPAPLDPQDGIAELVLTPADLEHRIKELAGQPDMGYRRIAAALQEQGFIVNHMKVARVLGYRSPKKKKVK